MRVDGGHKNPKITKNGPTWSAVKFDGEPKNAGKKKPIIMDQKCNFQAEILNKNAINGLKIDHKPNLGAKLREKPIMWANIRSHVDILQARPW